MPRVGGPPPAGPAAFGRRSPTAPPTSDRLPPIASVDPGGARMPTPTPRGHTAPLAAALLAGALVTATVTATATGPAAARAAAPAAGPRAAPAAAVHRILFDDTKAETAGNADWIIGTSMPDPLGQNPAPTSESSWTGAISAWGVALQRTGGYSLKTLPPGAGIGYGGGGALDLANFDEFVIPEPNILFTPAEKLAIMQFVQHGGGLFLVVDHTGSDRNNDGADSVRVVNDLMTSNGVDNTDPFGFSVDAVNIANENPVAIADSTNPVIHGPFGTVTGSIIRSGSTQTLHPADNPSVRGLVWRPGSSQTGSTGAFFTTATFGSGRVAVWGDSSAIDDGTGQPGNTLYDGWDDPAGTDAALALNATAWLAGAGTSGGGGGGCTSAQLLGNPGFESGGAAPWSATAGVINSSAAEPAHSGSYDAWLDGTGGTHTDTLAQSVTLPTGCTSLTLSYWLHIDSAETTTTTAYDTLTVAAGGTTLARYTNLDRAGGYAQRRVNLAGYAGQSLTISFTGTEDYTKQTSFVLDDVAVTAVP
jgi:hypothetical protein